MANIRIKDLPSDSAPNQNDIIPIDLAGTRGATIKDVVESGRPTASKSEAEAGVEPQKAMTPLTTKQAIDAQVSAAYVPKTVKVTAGDGLTGGGELSGDVTVGLTTTNIDRLNKVDGIEAGAQVNTVNSVNAKTGNVVLSAGDVGLGNVDNTSDASKPISTATQAALDDKANSSVTISAGSGLTGGGTLAANRTLALSSTSIASLALADSAVQSVNGKSGSSVTLTKDDVGLGNVDNTSDASKPISTATQTALNAKANSAVTITAGAGLAGGGDLTANRTVSLNPASIASLAKADTSVQPSDSALVPSGGNAGEVLVKTSGSDYDTDWQPIAAATAVSYAPQTLTEAQQGQARANIGADVLSGFRNKIINGDFDFWQRGVSQSTTGYASDDRWRSWFNGGTTGSNTREPTGYVPEAPGNPNWYAKVSITSPSASGFCAKEQRIEGIRTLAGKRATLTFYAKANAPRQMGVSFRQVYGGGSPTRTFGGSVLDLTVSMQRFDVVVDIPDHAGQSWTADGYLSVLLWVQAGASSAVTDIPTLGNSIGDVTIGHVSLVEGDATAEDDPFSPRHIQQELTLCQRYFQQVSASSRMIATAANQNADVTVNWQTMRVAPTSTIASAGVTNNLAVPATLTIHATNGGRLETKSAAAGIFYALNVSINLDAEL